MPSTAQLPEELTEEYARTLDQADELAPFRERFAIPQRNGTPVVYLCGHSLGLMPKDAPAAIAQELDAWARLGVEGHFHAPRPWFSYHREVSAALAELLGALPHEVVAMNSLTVNLHLLLASFYRPRGQRRKILLEHFPFPSDLYVAQTHVRWHGLDPQDVLELLAPRPGEATLRTEDICRRIEELGEELALVFMSSVHYYTGQRFDVEAITAAAHRAGALAGFDLAHAIGNVELRLHDWEVDFAAWCSYKYLNSGPGGVGGIFVHERHGLDPGRFRLGGWWGTPESVRFQLLEEFSPAPGAEGWQLSNAPILPLAVHRVALRLFQEARTRTALPETGAPDRLRPAVDRLRPLTPASSSAACDYATSTGARRTALAPGRQSARARRAAPAVNHRRRFAPPPAAPPAALRGRRRPDRA
jgi:kynureninase